MFEPVVDAMVGVFFKNLFRGPKNTKEDEGSYNSLEQQTLTSRKTSGGI